MGKKDKQNAAESTPEKNTAQQPTADEAAKTAETAKADETAEKSAEPETFTVTREQMEKMEGLANTGDLSGTRNVGGIIGNLIKTNASISGAECGCQAEIGSACSMAAAALAELHGMELDQIEYAAEVAMEHHLGLTCDPVRGLVQIPCIERNAVAAMRAINALSLANFLTYTRKISFDVVVNTMYETGRDLFSKYRETGEGGLAKYYTGKK